MDTSSDKVYHVSIMPCFDKKLESSRKDFMDEETDTKDVDCVLSTLELEELLEKEKINLNDLKSTGHGLDYQDSLYTHQGGGKSKYCFGLENY